MVTASEHSHILLANLIKPFKPFRHLFWRVWIRFQNPSCNFLFHNVGGRGLSSKNVWSEACLEAGGHTSFSLFLFFIELKNSSVGFISGFSFVLLGPKMLGRINIKLLLDFSTHIYNSFSENFKIKKDGEFNLEK